MQESLWCLAQKLWSKAVVHVLLYEIQKYTVINVSLKMIFGLFGDVDRNGAVD